MPRPDPMNANVVSLTETLEPAWAKMRAALFADEPRELIDAEADQLARTGRLKDQPFQCLIALDAGREPCGFIELSLRSSAENCLTAPVAYVEAWYVEPRARGRGVGRALMQAAMDFARSPGGWNCREIASDARPENRQSAAAHAALGFEDAGVIRCFRRSLEPRPPGAPPEQRTPHST